MVKVHKVVRQLKSSDDNINQGTTLMAIEKKLLQQVLIELKSDKEKRVSVNDQRESLGDTEQLLGDLERYVKIRQETDALVLKEDKKNYKQRGYGRKDFKAAVKNVKTNNVLAVVDFADNNNMYVYCLSFSL